MSKPGDVYAGLGPGWVGVLRGFDTPSPGSSVGSTVCGGTAGPIFPPLVAQMVAVGEESGSLGQMLDNVADYYDMEINQATESLSSAIEPILIVFLGVVVGGMVISLYLPMFSMFDTMNQQ